jgi:hypothetical protein
VAREAIEKLMKALEPYSDVSHSKLNEVLRKLVLSYGGDPLASRQRLDNLMSKEKP